MKHPAATALASAFMAASAAAFAQAPVIVDALIPPADEKPAFKMAAVGVQVYECAARPDDAKSFQWMFSAPEAKLTENGKPAGKHYSGPYWEAADGSKVKGAVRRGQDGGAGNIPWLLLAGTSEGKGKFAGVTSIQRISTKGGVEPKGGCNASKAGQSKRVAYKADYIFFKKG